MPFKYSFENLDVWKLAKTMAVNTRKMTSLFPKIELFGLSSQINRSSLSIASNIAEGTSRKSFKDQSHFTTIAYGSTIEFICQLEIAKDLNYINDEVYDEFRKYAEEITNKLNSLWKYQKNSVSSLTTKQLND